jgi:hypothetical protein
MARNPSELARLEEELRDAITAFFAGRTRTPSFAVDKGYKKAREALLLEIERLTKVLGYSTVPYNSAAWKPYYEGILKDITH